MKETAPTSTIRPIKGIATTLDVATFDVEEISDDICRQIIEGLEHEGQLPRRKMVFGEGGVAIAPGKFNVTIDGEIFRCWRMNDFLDVRRA